MGPHAVPAGASRRTWVIVAAVAAVVAGGWWLAAPGAAGRARAAALAVAGSDFARAEPALTAALARDPADVEVVEALARGHLAANDRAEAEADLARWIALRPTDPEPLRLRIKLYRDQRRHDRAYADGRRLLELVPNPAAVRWEVTGLAYSAGEFAAAEELCRAGLAAGEAKYRVALAEARRARGDAAGAAAVLDEALRANPADVPALLVRATLYDEAGEPAKAAPLLREAIRLDPDRRLEVGYRLGVILERAGLADEARELQAHVRRLQDVATADDAAQNRPADPDLRVRLGRELLAAGHDAAGVRFLRAALAIDPDFAPAHAALADYYAARGQPAAAADHRRRAGGR